MEVSLIQRLSELALTGRYQELLDVCEEVQLDELQSREFYVFHFFACYLAKQPQLAKLLWKRVPEKYREEKPTNAELRHTWQVGRALYKKDYPQVYREIDGYAWQTTTVVQEFRKEFVLRMTHLISTAFKSISVTEAAGLLGMTPDAAAAYGSQHGWLVKGSFLQPVIQSYSQVKEFSPSSLENLTSLMAYLERATSYAK